MSKQAIATLYIAVCAISFLTGCASTKVKVENESSGMLPRPDQVFVYDLAVTPGEVKLDSGIAAKIEELAKKTPRTQEEIAVGRQVADALSRHLVAKIQAMGFLANRAVGTTPTSGNILAIKGQFISIDEGNRTERVVIGLGLGRTDVRAMIQVYDYDNGGQTLACQFETDARSGRKPGMAETMGAGAAMGHLATAAAVGGGLTVASETLSATVEADADRTATKIASQLKSYFKAQGWMF
jgi:hypothetical protein